MDKYNWFSNIGLLWLLEILSSSYLQDEKDFFTQPLGRDYLTGAFYCYSKVNQDLFIQKFDAENKLIQSKKINFSSLKESVGNNCFINKAIMLKDRFVFLLIFLPNSKLNNSVISKMYIQDVSFEGNLLSPIRAIQEVRVDAEVSMHLSSSPDTTSIILCTAIPGKKKTDKNIFTFRIYSNTMEEVYSKELTISDDLNTTYGKIVIENVLITNSKEVYLLGTKNTNQQIRSCALFYLDRNSNQFQPIKLEGINPLLIGLSHEHISEYRIANNSKGGISFMGLYEGPSEKNHYYTGYFYGTINSTNLSVDDLKKIAIPMDKQNPPYSTDLYLPELRIISKKDGGYLLILEYKWYKSNNAHYGDILVLNLSADGSLIYCTEVFKNQTKAFGAIIGGEYTLYYSYIPLFNSSTNMLSLIFYDTAKNSTRTDDDSSFPLLGIKNGILVSLEINEKGLQRKKIVALPDNDTTILSTIFYTQDEDKEAIVFGVKEDKVFLGKVISE